MSKYTKHSKVIVLERVELIKKLKLCFNCLLYNHCQKSYFNLSSLKCKKRHYTILYFENQSDSATQSRENHSTNTKQLHLKKN